LTVYTGPMNDQSKSGSTPVIKDPIQEQKIDVSRLPDLPPPESKAWGRSRRGERARWVRWALKDSILAEVGDEEKRAFLDTLDRFNAMVKDSDDPYPIIGRFVKIGREVLDDHVVDSGEIEKLNRLLEEELNRRAGTTSR